MGLFDLLTKKKTKVETANKHKPYALTTKVDGVELVSGEYRIISRLEGRNFLSLVMHLDSNAKLQLYEDLTGIKLTSEDFKMGIGKSFRDLELGLDRKISDEIKKREISIILK